MKPIIFVDGDQGTTGLQIMSRLAPRNDIALLTLAPDERKSLRHRTEAINSCDIAILCLPDEAARDAAAAISNPAVRVIDASSAHRTHTGWVYGLPEIGPSQSAAIARAHRVSNPGCYPTGAIALLHPLIAAGILPPDYPLVIHAVSGYSGRGRAGVEAHENGSLPRPPAFQVYGLALDHKHVPEIRKHAGLTQRPFFVPAYGSFRQGIVLTIPLQLGLLRPGVDSADLRACLAQHYVGARYVNVIDAMETGSLQGLNPEAFNDSNNLALAVFGHDAHGQVLLSAVFDNLGKGASGAAVQNLDLMLEAQ